MARVCIVMPYYKRQYQLNKTLQTIAESKHDDFMVFVIDDMSPEDIVLPEGLPYPIEVIKIRNKNWTNCGPVYNTGFNRALEYKPDVMILQSAECYHVGDLISHAATNITDKNYIAYGCFQLDHDTTFSEHDIIELSTTNCWKVDGDPNGMGMNAWWNHSKYSKVPQYWGAAISARNLVAINGIDERFAHGYAYEDGYFIIQIEKMGLNIEIVDYPFVVHQWHPRELPQGWDKLLKENVETYKILSGAKEYRSKHFITPDLQWSGS